MLPEGLRIIRLLMVISSLSPLFILWMIRGVPNVSDYYLVLICILFIAIPNFALYERWQIAKRNSDIKMLKIGKSDDARNHLLVYLFAILFPLYDVNLGSDRQFYASIAALLFIVFIFWHLNMHYINIIYAIAGYKVYTVFPGSQSGAGFVEPYVLITTRSYLSDGMDIKAYRLSDTVFFETKGLR